MADKLGIISRYFQHEVTTAAVHLATTAIAHGQPVTLLARDICRREVCKWWDSMAQNERDISFSDWMRSCSRIIWTSIPHEHEVIMAKQAGIITYLLLNWEELVPSDEKVVKRFDKLIAPYRCVAQALMRKWHVKENAFILLPWDVQAPITSRSEVHPHEYTNVYFPLYDSQSVRSDQAIFGLMSKALSSIDNVHVTIARGRRWALSARCAVRCLSKQFPGRVHLCLLPNELERLKAFADADLTAWASRFESFAIIGLTSLCMGTPVISWDVRPQNEYLVAWKNSVLVPCKTEENWLGVPEVMDGYKEFGEALVATLRDRALIGKMKLSASVELVSRRKQFEAGWKEISK